MVDISANNNCQGEYLLSVLLPVLNGGETISDAIDSLIEQDFKNFEILIIDGGSKDDTLSIIEEYMSRDSRIKLFKKDAGLGESLNFLLSMTSAKYCARMDADDISLPTRFSSQIELLEARDDIVLTGTQISYFSCDNVITRTPYSCDHYKILDDLEQGIFSLAHPSIMFRTADAKYVGGYRETEVGEDLQFFLDLTQRGKLANTSDVGLLYRYAPGSLTSDPQKAERIEMLYAYTLKKWHSKNDSLTFKEFSYEWNNRPILKKATSWFKRKGDFLHLKFIVLNQKKPFKSYVFLFLSVMCKPDAAVRHLKRRVLG